MGNGPLIQVQTFKNIGADPATFVCLWTNYKIWGGLKWPRECLFLLFVDNLYSYKNINDNSNTFKNICDA